MGPDDFESNPNGQYIGCFYFANNVAYENGINGLVVHKSNNSIVMNNTVYNNGATPLSSNRQPAGGITVNNSVNVRIYNNISCVRHKSDFCYQAFGHVDNIEGKINLHFHSGPIRIKGLENMLHGDPLFKDASSKKESELEEKQVKLKTPKEEEAQETNAYGLFGIWGRKENTKEDDFKESELKRLQQKLHEC